MPSRKVLNSVAHNLGHSFISLMNYTEGDYVMGHLVRNSWASQVGELHIDILHSKWSQNQLCTFPVELSLKNYCNWFPQLVKSHGSSMDFIREAEMTIKIDYKTIRFKDGNSKQKESPFTCEVNLVDDKGKVHIAKFADWWYPEI